MKILDRYLLRELIPPFVLGLSVFTFILLMGKIIRLMELIIVNQIPVRTVGLLILYLLPSMLIFIIPMSLLMAILILYGRLSSDNEVLAFQSAGVSRYRLMSPVLIASVLTLALTLFISSFLMPKANAAFQQLILNTTWKNATLGLKEKTFYEYLENMVIYVDTISDSSLTKVIVSDQRKKGESVTIFAKEGEIMANNRLFKLILRLKDGTIHRHDPKNTSKYQQLIFSTYDILLSGSGSGNKKNFRTMGLRELRQEIEKQKKLGHQAYQLLIEWHQRLSIPFACLVFALVACPLGMQNRRGTKLSSLGLSVIIILIYYAFLAGGKTLVYGGWVPAWSGMWLPDFILAATGIYLVKQLETIK